MIPQRASDGRGRFRSDVAPKFAVDPQPAILRRLPHLLRCATAIERAGPLLTDLAEQPGKVQLPEFLTDRATAKHLLRGWVRWGGGLPIRLKRQGPFLTEAGQRLCRADGLTPGQTAKPGMNCGHCADRARALKTIGLMRLILDAIIKAITMCRESGRSRLGYRQREECCGCRITGTAAGRKRIPTDQRRVRFIRDNRAGKALHIAGRAEVCIAAARSQ